ncbi:insulin-like receptor isoform X2 [Galleria mellonella]|uniref:Tyrosine-protein kinase receptor n=1 Tax=Galleria mellonella TaxID=7137 RepID=A0A6J1WSP7_GALME|nr:insulin-like receptor isoform X2 [Galleria mellonella]
MRRACDATAWPVAACALLLACTASCAVIEHLAEGVCPSMDIRTYPENMEKLRGCRVIEGQLSIVLMERANPRTFENVSFPELREVTEYIKIYRAKGVRNLGDLFPNLTVVRGMRLYKDYAIVIYDNEHLESLGLRSLSRIERGAVRIQHNDQLCYTDTVDWSQIIAKDLDNVFIRSNYDPRLCGLCPEAQSRTVDHPQSSSMCPTDASGTLLCWDDKHCQKICPSACGESGCMNNRTCCHRSCLGGCNGPTSRDCFACKHYSFKYGSERTCVENCPRDTYKLFARCVAQEECRKMPPPPPLVGSSETNQQRPDSNIKAYKIFNDSCVYICPSGYMEVGDVETATCIPCPKTGCVRECSGGKIDSIAAAERYRGCTHINGKLEITLRASGGNTMAVLESSLGEIREIVGCLQVTRSYMLISLMFLKSLKKIVGVPGENKGQVLNIFNNPNLELLWDWPTHGPIDISKGTLHIHMNPKLCYDRILPLKNMTHDPRSEFSVIEVSEDNNGDQASCFPNLLNLNVSERRDTVVVLTWNMYCVEDIRKLLGYSLYYIVADKDVTLYGQRDACSDAWNVVDITIDEARLHSNRSAELQDPRTDIITNPCKHVQPSFRPLTDLRPYTRYAAYVKTYTTQQDKKGAQSNIIYFKTLPGQPSPPVNLIVEHNTAHSVNIRWSPPVMPNGVVVMYHVEIQANSYNKPKILGSKFDYCTNPNALANKIKAGHGEGPPELQREVTGELASNASCSCKDRPKSGVRFTSRAEEERIESINFENELQNEVYIKSEKIRAKVKNRPKRSIEQSNLQTMLVILSENNRPIIGFNYSNSTDGEGYVKSLFYELDSNTSTLTVNGLRHCTWYTVNVWACRMKDDNENKETYEKTWCSDRAYNTFRTLELMNADVIGNLQADILPSNKTLPEVNVTWEPPKNPNGFLAAYKVHYSRVEDSTQVQDLGFQTCVSSDDYETNGRTYMLRNLIAGNYSIKVTPITVSGAGNLSEIFIFIPERTANPGHEWIWGLVGGCVVMLMVVGGGIWYARRGLLPPNEGNKLFARVNPEYVSTVYVPDEWEVPRSNIEFIRELGQGSFGMVYEGIAKNIEKGKPETRCAVKTVNEHATDRERIEFLNEASVMKAFDTFHVVRLLGVVSRGQPTLVVMELMELGDLKTYLRSHRPDADTSLPKKDTGNPPTLQNILQMAIEIADGMAYLSAKKFVHRDLAARNCMVAGDLTVKVGDFGMTRDIYETDYYRKGTKGLLPVRWMSPESLKDGVFSSSSDVWSYGVVLWEMVTLAMLPYQGLSNEQVVRYVVEGGVMERPEHCPDRLYELMRACWAHRAPARPTFLQLAADLAPQAMPYFRHRSFFHSPQGQEMYALQRSTLEEEQEMPEVNVGAVATGSGSNLFGVSGRLASWVLSSLRSRGSDDAATEPLQPLQPLPPLQPAATPRALPLALKAGPNGVLRDGSAPAATAASAAAAPATTGC